MTDISLREHARLALLRLEKVYEHNYSRKINKERLNSIKRHYQAISLKLN